MLRETEIWIALAYLIGVVILIRYAGKPILGGLDSYAERIRQKLDEAARLRVEAEAMLAEYRRRLQEGGDEALAIVAKAREEVRRFEAAAAIDLEEGVKRRQRQAQQRIDRAEAEAVAEIRTTIVDLALAATSAVLARSLDWNRRSGLIDQAIATFPGRLN